MMKRGVPSVVLVTERFTDLARTTLRSRGAPSAPMLVLPASELLEYGPKELLEATAEKCLEDALKMLGSEPARTNQSAA